MSWDYKFWNMMMNDQEDRKELIKLKKIEHESRIKDLERERIGHCDNIKALIRERAAINRSAKLSTISKKSFVKEINDKADKLALKVVIIDEKITKLIGGK